MNHPTRTTMTAYRDADGDVHYPAQLDERVFVSQSGLRSIGLFRRDADGRRSPNGDNLIAHYGPPASWGDDWAWYPGDNEIVFVRRS